MINNNIENDIESLKQANDLAKEILVMCRNKLFVNFRFLESALAMLKIVPYSDSKELLQIYNNSKKNDNNSKNVLLETNGEIIRYNFVNILNQYKNDKNVINRCFLHTLLHCIYRHLFVGKMINQSCWDLACDIAVENIINELNFSELQVKQQSLQNGVISNLKKDVKLLTAEHIYNYYLEKNLSNEEYEKIRLSFMLDSHNSWYNIEKEINKIQDKNKSTKTDSQKNNTSSTITKNEDGKNDDVSNKIKENELEIDSSIKNNRFINESNIINDWKNIAEKISIDLEIFSKNHANLSESLIQNLREINREKCDYTKFLKKFAVRGEVMKINDDEFDYIFYTYGLKLYDNMPLIEPLEYKDVKKIKEFVIAIDTSGSVKGDIVQKFIEKTYNILKSTESFFSNINIHIIQCDTKICEDKKITSQKEFDDYIKNMTFKGFGGTDFRPVFNYVDKLIKNKDLKNLKGLIYFTDGYGEYPQTKPDYETAFIFVDNEYNNFNVPSWAIKVIMKEDDIKEF